MSSPSDSCGHSIRGFSLSCIHADHKYNSLPHHSPQCCSESFQWGVTISSGMLPVQAEPWDWSRNALQPNCVPSSEAQACKPLYPVPYLSSTMPGTEMQQLKKSQYQTVHSSLTGPNVLLITGSKKTNVDLGSNWGCWTHHFPFPYQLAQSHNKEFTIIHNIPLFCAAEHCISSSSSRHSLKQLWGSCTLQWLVLWFRIVTTDNKCRVTPLDATVKLDRTVFVLFPHVKKS